MTKTADLYPILKSFSVKTKSPYIDIDPFLEYLEKYAHYKAQENEYWSKWLENKNVLFWSELSKISETGRCVLLQDDSGGRIYMPYYYIDILREIYQDPDKVSDVPFPNEETLGLTIPETQMLAVDLNAEIRIILEPSGDSNAEASPPSRKSEQIIKLIFPEDCGSALLLRSMMPRKFLEAAMLKIRNYLNVRGNKEYALHKLTPQFQDREKYLRETLDNIMIRPALCLNYIEKSDEFSYIFWVQLCNLIKIDIRKKNEILSDELAALQSVYIIEVSNSYYQARAIRIKKRENAFRNLETNMIKPPYYFTREEISKFKTDKGIDLLGMYTKQELDEYIQNKTMEGKDNLLPEWFVINGKGVHWFIKKEKYLPACARMLIATKPLIKQEIIKRWAKILRNFRKEPAMEKDAEFDKLLELYTDSLNPVLSMMLKDQKMLWAFEEMEREQNIIPATLRFFKSGKLLPMNELYSISRKDFLYTAKSNIPFWLSIPIISAIAAFFHWLFKKKPKKQVQEQDDAETDEMGEDEKTISELRDIADSIILELIPEGQTMERYLNKLESKWNKLISAKSRNNLTVDVQTLVHDNLRKMLRMNKNKKISRKSIHNSAVQITISTSTLHSLTDQDSLCLYMELYMAKLLLNIK